MIIIKNQVLGFGLKIFLVNLLTRNGITSKAELANYSQFFSNFEKL